jgi:ribosomal protein L40E
MSVKQAVLDFADGETRNRIFIAPDIPIKKLNAARSQFVFRDDEVIVLYDDTVFGSGKDGLAITEEYIYAKQLWEPPKSIKISSIRSLSSQSKSLNNLEIYINNNHFITLSSSDADDHPFLMGILKAAKDAASKGKSKKAQKEDTAAPAAASEPRLARLPTQKRQAATAEKISCGECTADLPDGAKFCLECGAKVLPKGVCLECNAKLPEAARFCPECGTPAGKAGAKPAEPKADAGALRKELADWLAGADHEGWIDSDGDLAIKVSSPAPTFAKDLRGWIARYGMSLEAEGIQEERPDDTSSFAPGEDFYISSPYCRVGRLPSADYRSEVKLAIYALKSLEVHEIELRNGKLEIPKLASPRVNISSLVATKDEDGSYGVAYEIDAYEGHAVYFEVLSEKPEADSGVSAWFQDDANNSGTNWLWDVEPGRKIYVCFGEYELLVDGIQASFSGTVTPAEGAYDDTDDENSGQGNDSERDSSEGADGGRPTSLPGHKGDASVPAALQHLAEKTETSLTASGRLASYFSDCDNLYTSINLDHGPGNLLRVAITVETNGQAEDLEDAEEAIGDYIFDTFLTAGLVDIFGNEGYEALEFEVHVRITPLGVSPHSIESAGAEVSAEMPDYNAHINVREFLIKYEKIRKLDDELILLGFGIKDFSIKGEDYDGESDEDEWFRDLLCDLILSLKMDIGETEILGPCEVRCSFIHQICDKNENGLTEVINFYIIEFQCDTILVAIYGYYDDGQFISEYNKIVSTRGVHRTSETGYLTEMTEDLQAIEPVRGGSEVADKEISALISDAGVQDVLQSIEDKLLERGLVVSLLGGGDPEISIRFERINPYNLDRSSLFIVVNITDEDANPESVDEDDAESIGDFVRDKLSDFSKDFSETTQEILEQIEGAILRINGVYKG